MPVTLNKTSVPGSLQEPGRLAGSEEPIKRPPLTLDPSMTTPLETPQVSVAVTQHLSCADTLHVLNTAMCTKRKYIRHISHLLLNCKEIIGYLQQSLETMYISYIVSTKYYSLSEHYNVSLRVFWHQVLYPIWNLSWLQEKVKISIKTTDVYVHWYFWWPVILFCVLWYGM